MLKADAKRQNSTPGDDLKQPDDPGHAVRDYLAVLDNAAFGTATPIVPKSNPGLRSAWHGTGASGELTWFAYCTNYLVGLKHAVIMDVDLAEDDLFNVSRLDTSSTNAF